MEKIREVLKKVIYALYGVELEADVTVAPEGTGADYATNVAMRLAKVAHKAPMIIAEEIKARLDAGEIETDEGTKDVSLEGFTVTVAAPGFLNFISPDEYFAEKVGVIAGNVGDFLGKNISQGEYSGKTVVAEFSDPNPFKVLHVGHLYTSVVGYSISRIWELAGAKGVRANFVGEVGLHVGKTMWALSRKNVSLDELKIEDIAKCYVEGTQAYEENEEAKAEIVALNKVFYAVAELGAERSQERLEIEALAEDFGMSTVEMMKLVELYWRGRELSYE